MPEEAKRLAVLAPSMIIGGAERSMIKLCKGIYDRGLPVDLVLSKAEGEFLPEVPHPIPIVDLKARRAIASLPALVGYLRHARPAALLSILQMNVIAIWAKRLAGVQTRIIVSERNTLSREVSQYPSDVRMKIMPLLVRIFYPWADSVVAVSKGVADDLILNTGIPEKLVRVIYNPIITTEFIEKTRAPLISRLFDPGQPPVILAVGRLSIQKDFITLIKAFNQVRKRRVAHLLIIGEGEERPVLEMLIRELDLTQDVSLPGFIANPYPYMLRSALFVLSSKWEGLPGVLIEAMYCGLPLVATDCPSGPREILVDGSYGRLVPVGDVELLSRAIEDALDHKIPRPSQNGWKRFEANEIVDQYLTVLLGDWFDENGHKGEICFSDTGN